MADASKQEAQSAQGAAGCGAQRQFVNQLSLGFSLAGFELDLMQAPGPEGPPLVCCRIATTPERFAYMHAVMGGVLERYVARFGPIPPLATGTKEAPCG